MSNPVTIYVGYDQREDTPYRILEESIRRHSSKAVNIIPIKQEALRTIGLYSRDYTTSIIGNSIQKIDTNDKKPFSTDFSFTRFLVPHLNLFSGWALFIDCDMFFRSDVMELFDTYNDPEVALYTVEHNYKPTQSIKMDNQQQGQYNMKNWSSVMLWNCSHPIHRNLTVSDVNTKSGRWLHQFQWMLDNMDTLGDMDESWNWLDNHSSESIEAKNVHFTTGGPYFDTWIGSRDADKRYAAEWLIELEKFNNE
jgi:hypothetical protein|tara:strand:+ start:429 stop:1184 length:756 start_codon:yes stop_codon:yes gene_type:complete